MRKKINKKKRLYLVPKGMTLGEAVVDQVKKDQKWWKKIWWRIKPPQTISEEDIIKAIYELEIKK